MICLSRKQEQLETGGRKVNFLDKFMSACFDWKPTESRGNLATLATLKHLKHVELTGAEELNNTITMI